MSDLNLIINVLDEYLDSANIIDKAKNGLQVGRKNREISKIGFAVDATLDTFEKAKIHGCDLVIVHHGLLWNAVSEIAGNIRERLAYLLANDIALVCYHLPLDKHADLGNNAQIAKLLNLKNVKPFDVGVVGDTRQRMSVQELGLLMNKLLSTKCTVYNFGDEVVQRVSIISGSGSTEIEAASVISDCFIVGDVMYGMQHLARELRMNMISAGHYETETLGLEALMQFCKRKLDVEVVFLNGFGKGGEHV